jgi:probable selenium-dependent hydroxylase accessory protein YqeC
MDYQFFEPWHLFLPREAGHVVALFGGGGKTSLLAAMAAVYREESCPVALTTTTRTEPLAWPDLVPLEWRDLIGGAARPPTAGEPLLFVRDGVHTDGKWRGLQAEAVDALEAQLPGRVILVEADGSAGMPVKLHAPGEPVWPRRTSLAVAVMGLSAIGRPPAEVLHRHGRQEIPWLSGADGATTWSWDHMFRLLAGAGGYLSRVPAGTPSLLILTQLGGLADSVGLFGFTGRVLSETDVPIVLFGELGGEAPSLRGTCRMTPEAGS